MSTLYKGNEKCPQCGRFVDPDGRAYFDTAERGAIPDMSYVAAFCDEQCAAKFHGRSHTDAALAKVQS